MRRHGRHRGRPERHRPHVVGPHRRDQRELRGDPVRHVVVDEIRLRDAEEVAQRAQGANGGIARPALDQRPQPSDRDLGIPRSCRRTDPVDHLLQGVAAAERLHIPEQKLDPLPEPLRLGIGLLLVLYPGRVPLAHAHRPFAHPPVIHSTVARPTAAPNAWSTTRPTSRPKADLDLFSFLCADLLHHIARQLDLHPRQTLADLGCGRGGPGLWLASRAHAALVGIDFSPVAIAQARHRAVPFATDAAFAVADLTRLPLTGQCVDRALSLDALQYAPDRVAAARQALSILKPGGRLVLTGWQPHTPGDERLPPRHRHTDWTRVLHTAGFTDGRLAQSRVAVTATRRSRCAVGRRRRASHCSPASAEPGPASRVSAVR
ncbi:class I SAM-dependent methyltransferase [Streptomyces bobili]|uniref:class I SAM-dependent methyltransferase n=1 Tax=Streptomyces bobili TaxID=67280 RepID=UPI0034423E15